MWRERHIVCNKKSTPSAPRKGKDRMPSSTSQSKRMPSTPHHTKCTPHRQLGKKSTHKTRIQREDKLIKDKRELANAKA